MSDIHDELREAPCDWVILIGAGYGAFLFHGTEQEAEDMRAHKARWERGIGKKRLATEDEVAADKLSRCLNHPGFGNKVVYCDCYCEDMDCIVNAQDRLRNERRAKKRKHADYGVDPMTIRDSLAQVQERRDISQIERRSIPVPESGCWLWAIGMTSGEYGAFSQGRGVVFKAHRYAYECVHGLIPAGLHILHSCDTPLCVNPAHLRAGTQAENSADMKARGRSLSGERNPSAKLSQETVDMIRIYPAGYDRTAKHFGISRSVVRDIRKGRSWTTNSRTHGPELMKMLEGEEHG